MIHSEIKLGGRMTFPTNKGERIYMLPFFQRTGLPPHLSRWQRTVDQMLAGVSTDDPIYLMIDQGIVEAGSTQRRPGLHIEGNWDGILRHHPAHRHGRYDVEMVILASDVGGCRAVLGCFDGHAGPQGQCEHIDIDGGDSVVFEPSRAYRGTATTIHESLPMRAQTQRTIVRLNLPGVAL